MWAASAAPLIAVIAASAACDAFGSNDPTEEPVDAGTKPAFCDKHHEALACLDFENADPEPTRGWVGGLLKSPFDKVYQDGKLEIETRPNDAGKRLLATALGNTKYGAIQMKPLQGSYWTLRMRVQIDATAPPPYEVQVFNIKALAEYYPHTKKREQFEFDIQGRWLGISQILFDLRYRTPKDPVALRNMIDDVQARMDTLNNLLYEFVLGEPSPRARK